MITDNKTIHNADILDFLGRLELGGSKTGPGMAVEAEALLNATGRQPRTEGLDLEAAGIQCNLVNHVSSKGGAANTIGLVFFGLSLYDIMALPRVRNKDGVNMSELSACGWRLVMRCES